MIALPKLPLDLVHTILWALWRRRWLVVVPMLLLPPLAFAIGMITPKTWRASMTVLVQEAAQLNPFLKDLVVATNLEGRMRALAALLQSRQLVGQVAADLKWIDEATPPVERERVISWLGRSIKVELIGKELLEIRYTADAPQGMDEVLIAVSRRFMDRVLAPERSSLAGSEAFLGTQLRTVADELEALERALADHKTRNAGALPELHAANVERLSAARRALVERRTALAGAEAGLAARRERLALTDPVVGQIEAKLVDLAGQIAMALARYTEDHSDVQSLRRQIQRLESERAAHLASPPAVAEIDRLWNLAAGIATTESGDRVLRPLMVSQLEALQTAMAQVRALTTEVAVLGADVAALESRVEGHAEVERTLRRLEREVGLKRDLFTQLKSRAQMARVTADLGAFEAPERIRVIDPPQVPTRPVTPPPLLFAAAGVIAGLLLGCGLAVLAELFDGRLRTIAQAKRLTGLPVLARVPRVPTDSRVGTDGFVPLIPPETPVAIFGGVPSAVGGAS
ncbi:MAG: capsule biosynthesis protein [Alphaproteobacteria bacterium]|nr:GNVR domain-containing protein [Alphaproteobacteria bacterium]TAD89630.1 MAG: capsule biosynthesis protein [Alphaproteobacteria bacterium]